MVTQQDIIDYARMLLKDPDGASPRWLDEWLTVYIADAVQRAWQVAPYRFLSDSGNLDRSPTDTALQCVPLRGWASYVAARALMEDSDDQNNLAAAEVLMAEFGASL